MTPEQKKRLDEEELRLIEAIGRDIKFLSQAARKMEEWYADQKQFRSQLPPTATAADSIHNLELSVLSLLLFRSWRQNLID